MMKVARETTRALLVAGRALDSYLVTWGDLAAIRQIAGPHGLAVLIAGDETLYPGTSREAGENVFSRVVIGVVAASADADGGPGGPVEPAALETALQQVAAIGDAPWLAIAEHLQRTPPRAGADERRASLPDRLKRGFEGVAFDGPDLVLAQTLLHLMPSGPLAAARLACGIPGDLPPHADEDDGDEDAGDPRQGWEYGQDMSQETHRRGVHGIRLGSADSEGLGTWAFSLAELRRRLADSIPGSGLFLIARYD